MTVRVADNTVVLEGECSLEDADRLQQALLAHPEASVDWRKCSGAHTAVVQVLLAARPAVWGLPQGPALRRFVSPFIPSRDMTAGPGHEVE